MPSNQSPLGALPARFRRQRILIVGCGDVGMRLARDLLTRARVMALTSSPGRVAELRAKGIAPLIGNLDQRTSLGRLAGIAHRVVYLAPPPGNGEQDGRAVNFVHAMRRRTPPRSIVYGSTSGVYGDCQGHWVVESRTLNPGTPRALRRVHAEQIIRLGGRSSGMRCSVLRIPGIYAVDREGGTPRDRLGRGTPVLRVEDDVFTNHIHADDLALACLLACWRGGPQRSYNINDDTSLLMGDYFDLAADLYGMQRPQRISKSEAGQQLSPMLLSFMGESRRMVNLRMKKELRLQLRYPTVVEGLRPGPCESV